MAVLLPGGHPVLSICQYDNMLWGFQMAWYLVLVSMAVAF